MTKIAFTLLAVLVFPFASFAKEWKDSYGKSLGNWAFKEISAQKIVTLENRGATKKIPFSNLCLEDQKEIASNFAKAMFNDCLETLDIDAFVQKYDGKPVIFQYEVADPPEEYIEDYRALDLPFAIDASKMPKIPKVKVNLSAKDAPIPDGYLVLVKRGNPIVQPGHEILLRLFLRFPSKEDAKIPAPANRKIPSASTRNRAEAEDHSAIRRPRDAQGRYNIREGVRLPLNCAFGKAGDDGDAEERNSISLFGRTGGSGKAVFCSVEIADVRLSLAQKGKPEQLLKLDDPRKEFEEAAKKHFAAQGSVQARQDTQNRINQRRAETNEGINQKKRYMGIPH